MRFVSRLTLTLAVPVALAAGFALLPARWTDGLGLGALSPANLRRELADAYRRRSEIRYRIEVANRRSEARQRLIEEVIAGRETLLGAAARLREIYRPSPDDGPEYPRSFPGDSEGERLCREVIARVANELGDTSPGRTETCVNRLEAELQELLRTPNGVVVVPRE